MSGANDLQGILEQLSPTARDSLRRLLVMDQSDRDVVATTLLRYRDATGNDWADIIDLLSIHPEARRRVVRLLAEFDASHT